MNSLGLYLTSVLIWGSTWWVITFQFGPVPPAISVCYRFALASLVLFAWCRARGLRLAFSTNEHLWMALQGMDASTSKPSARRWTRTLAAESLVGTPPGS